MDKAIAAQIRLRIRWIYEGELSTSYFLGIEKHRQSHNKIEALVQDNITY